MVSEQDVEGAQVRVATAAAKRIDVRSALRIKRDELAVDDERGDRELAGGPRDMREAGRDVDAMAGQQDSLAAIPVDLDTPAIELDLVRPQRARRRFGTQEG